MAPATGRGSQNMERNRVAGFERALNLQNVFHRAHRLAVDGKNYVLLKQTDVFSKLTGVHAVNYEASLAFQTHRGPLGVGKRVELHAELVLLRRFRLAGIVGIGT